MQPWQNILKNSLTSPADLGAHHGLDLEELHGVTSTYPMRINPYYLSLIHAPGDPLWRQAVPDARELTDTVCHEDPLDEENLSPVPNLVHKYPDRALFLVTSQCAMYCRFCTRKRKVGTDRMAVTPDTIQAGLDYLRKTPEIRDVLVSGGDPLLLSDEALASILEQLRRIPSIEIIRIGSRVPCTLPMRVTTRLARLLKKFHPLYLNTHFNHPAEITPQAALACARLADAGIPLGCQTVLLKGVNDHPATMRELMHGLLRIRVKPYYVFQGDMTKGTNHFRTPIRTGLEIMEALIRTSSGMAIPAYTLDLPGGGGKVRLRHEHLAGSDRHNKISNSQGGISSYLDAT